MITPQVETEYRLLSIRETDEALRLVARGWLPAWGLSVLVHGGRWGLRREVWLTVTDVSGDGSILTCRDPVDSLGSVTFRIDENVICARLNENGLHHLPRDNPLIQVR